VGANPTHYGDPKTGCESDEQAVQVQGLSGDFCSPKCDSSGSCPTDKPAGDAASPSCALQTTTGDQYCAMLCKADSECGTGSCQSVSGQGICTYSTSALISSVKRIEVKLAEAVGANPTHYGDPKTGCESDEQAVQVQGLSGDFCSPKCDSSGSCPTDKPAGDAASPSCALQTTTGDQYCAMLCKADSECGTGSCQSVSGQGICTYSTSALISSVKRIEVKLAEVANTLLV